MSATYKGPALSDTISQAAPTLCMNVPMSDTTSATMRLRKTGVRRGCSNPDVCFIGWLAALNDNSLWTMNHGASVRGTLMLSIPNPHLGILRAHRLRGILECGLRARRCYLHPQRR